MLMIDQNQIYVNNYEEVLMMDRHFFKIQMKDYDLNIRGEDLQIYYYDCNEIRLNGHVKVIEYDENRA